MQLAFQRPEKTDRGNPARTRLSRAGGNATAGEDSPYVRNPAGDRWSALVEERVDGGLDGCCKGRGHVGRRQLPADGERTFQRVTGIAAVRTFGEMRLHLRARARIDLTFEMLREERQDIRA